MDCFISLFNLPIESFFHGDDLHFQFKFIFAFQILNLCFWLVFSILTPIGKFTFVCRTIDIFTYVLAVDVDCPLITLDAFEVFANVVLVFESLLFNFKACFLYLLQLLLFLLKFDGNTLFDLVLLRNPVILLRRLLCLHSLKLLWGALLLLLFHGQILPNDSFFFLFKFDFLSDFVFPELDPPSFFFS